MKLAALVLSGESARGSAAFEWKHYNHECVINAGHRKCTTEVNNSSKMADRIDYLQVFCYYRYLFSSKTREILSFPPLECKTCIDVVTVCASGEGQPDVFRSQLGTKFSDTEPINYLCKMLLMVEN